MGNASELLINLVRVERLKRLKGLGQNGKWVDVGLVAPYTDRPNSHRGIGRP